jgi:hypothetical protein
VSSVSQVAVVPVTRRLLTWSTRGLSAASIVLGPLAVSAFGIGLWQT